MNKQISKQTDKNLLKQIVSDNSYSNVTFLLLRAKHVHLLMIFSYDNNCAKYGTKSY